MADTTDIPALRAELVGSLIRNAALKALHAKLPAADATLERADLLKRPIEEASTFPGLEHLALSPQCEFASGAAGGQMGIEMEDKKLRRVVDVARDVWGTA
jgi:hypothetical protein